MFSLRRSGAVLSAAAMLSGVAVTAGATPASAAPAPTPPAYFGVHHNLVADPASPWPKAPVGAVRLWDSGVSWRDVEPADNQWNWAKLDQQVAVARSKGADPMIVLGGTPQWASARGKSVPPGSEPLLGPGAADMPVAAAWVDYVRQIVARYSKRGVTNFQVWNEPNVVRFWNGSPAEMKKLSDQARSVLKSVSPKSKFISPSFPLRLKNPQRNWFEAYTKTGVMRTYDAIALNPYPVPNQGPEESMALIAYAKAVLKKYKVPAKPIWNTEINYGLAGAGQKQRVLPAALAAGYVARTMLLNKAGGVGRVYWYSWNYAPFFGINTTAKNSVTLTPAGTAFVTSRRWMSGQVLNGCTRDKAGTYKCTITTAKTRGFVYWNPVASRRPVVKAPAKTYQFEYVNGKAVKARPGSGLKVGQVPVLIRVKR